MPSSSKQLQKCEALIKKHKVEVIDLKAIDLTDLKNYYRKVLVLMVQVMDLGKLKTAI
jgi:hypothetical protein